jgi:hypothetical protein
LATEVVAIAVNWVLDPAPVISVRSKGESTLVAPTQSAAGESGLGMAGALRFVHRPEELAAEC